ncbi:hypothetical protein [Herbiconiux sp.]|jgi:hypothetical protein|uniref:hypothetical protein n=1 Tax=Herbiconiux sp. TaxID=1871186 RepID=UPI0025C65F74|nr:hypothetical protein [Herbiconiux sp.]
MRISKYIAVAGVVAVVVGLSACSSTPAGTSSSSEAPIGGDVITPLTVEANDLQGETVDLVVGQVLNINTGDLATDSYTGEVADTSVASFVKGTSGGSAETNPGVEALAVGETEVTLTNADGGIQPLTFTVVVAK